MQKPFPDEERYFYRSTRQCLELEKGELDIRHARESVTDSYGTAGYPFLSLLDLSYSHE